MTRPDPRKLTGFAVASVMAFAAVVNHGMTGSLIAIPFVAFLVWAALRWGRGWIVATACIFGVLAPLYIAKLHYPVLYYPVIGQKIHLTEDVCASDYGVWMVAPWRRPSDPPSARPDCGSMETLPTGTSFVITRVERPGPFMTSYILWAHAEGLRPADAWINVPEEDPVNFVAQAAFDDGRPVTEEAVRERAFFRYPVWLVWFAIPAAGLLLILFVLSRK
ncbi:MAG: hypothetical protein M3O22_00595 [Pseudomonadota bacterium]|nr:hypothetical protein [Pseudomonadota bacterium]